MQEFRSYSFAANYVSIKVPNSVTVITTSKINWQERGDERAIKVIKAFSLKNNLKLHQQILMFIRAGHTTTLSDKRQCDNMLTLIPTTSCGPYMPTVNIDPNRKKNLN